MSVKNIMSEPITVHKSDTISHAMDLMDKHDTRRLLVINGNELMGLITMRNIANKLGTWKTSNLPASSLHVAAATSTLFTTVLPDMSFDDAIGLLDRKSGVLVVMDSNKVKGWVTPNEILKNVKGLKGYAAEIMKEPITVSPGDRVSHARRIMLDNDIGRLPIVENNDVVGIITEKDVARAMMNFRALVPDNQQDERIRNLIVGDIMTRNVISVRTNTPIMEVISILLKENIGGVPVLNLKDDLVGIVSRRGIIRHLAAKG
jgi:CBS domain-containing protein